MKSLNESKNGFWGVLARKAKSIIEDDNDNVTQQSEVPGTTRSQLPGVTSRGKVSFDYISSPPLGCCLYVIPGKN